MPSGFSRRQFLTRLGATFAASAPWGVLARTRLDGSRSEQAQGQPGTRSKPLYPPTDLSYFDKPISRLPHEVRFGYAAITWEGHDLEAIEDISSLGFKAIQLRSNILKEFGDKPAALKELLRKHHLTMVAFSSGGVNIERDESQVLATHTAHAKFVHDVGGLYLQLTDDRPKGRAVTREDYKHLGRLLTEIGKRASDYGVPVGYHNHMGSLGERPEELDWILEATDPHWVKLELDTAHCLQGGGDPAKVIERYRNRLLFLHIKDVEPFHAEGAKHDYRFVELGRGRVDLPVVFAALKKVGFRGWAIIELDGETDKSRTPKESAAISKKYVEETLGYKI